MSSAAGRGSPTCCRGCRDISLTEVRMMMYDVQFWWVVHPSLGSTSKCFWCGSLSTSFTSSAQFWRKGRTFRFCKWPLRAQICYTAGNTRVPVACLNHLDVYHGSDQTVWQRHRVDFPTACFPRRLGRARRRGTRRWERHLRQDV